MTGRRPPAQAYHSAIDAAFTTLRRQKRFTFASCVIAAQHFAGRKAGLSKSMSGNAIAKRLPFTPSTGCPQRAAGEAIAQTGEQGRRQHDAIRIGQKRADRFQRQSVALEGPGFPAVAFMAATRCQAGAKIIRPIDDGNIRPGSNGIERAAHAGRKGRRIAKPLIGQHA
jgi:hypothetical protein